MMQSPTSLTATIHVKFHYGEPGSKLIDDSQLEMINAILHGANNLDPALQELIIGFVHHLKEVNKDDEAESG